MSTSFNAIRFEANRGRSARMRRPLPASSAAAREVVLTEPTWRSEIFLKFSFEAQRLTIGPDIC
jgi:hypothetical protein